MGAVIGCTPRLRVVLLAVGGQRAAGGQRAGGAGN